VFKAENVPARIEALSYKLEKLGNGERHKAYKLRLSVDLTPALAADIPGAKSKVFKMNDGTPNDDVESITFSYVTRPLTVTAIQDPSLGPSFTLRDVQCRRFKTPKRLRGAVHMTFEAIALDVSPDDLIGLKEAAFEQRYFTFAKMQGGFFAEAEAEERRESKDAVQPKRGRKSGDADADAEPATEQPVAH
jgi:hypothetical protein